MATPSITNPFSGQELSTCEATTGWSGDTFVLEPGIKKQGSNSLTCQMTSNGANSAIFTPASSVNLTGQHIRCWYQSGLVAYIDIEANNGIEFWISDGTYTHRWTLGGSDNFPEGWTNMVIYAESTPTSGYNASFDFTAVTSMGFQFNTTSKPRGVDNFWVDYLRYGDGLVFTGGTAFTAGNYVTLNDIATIDAANGYGLLIKDKETGKFKAYGSITAGNGATATYFKEDDNTLTFVDTNVSSTLYEFVAQGSGCNIEWNNFTIDAFNQTFTLHLHEANINSLTIDGCTITNSDSVLFKSGQNIQNTVFNACDQIEPTTAVFKFNTIKNSTDTGGAVLWPSDSTNISDLTFSKCDNDIEYASTSDSTPTFTNIVHDDNAGDYDVNNTSGASKEIVLTGTSNANSYTGSTTTFSAPAVLTVTNLITLSDVVIYEAGTENVLDSVDQNVGTTWAYNYNGADTIDIGVFLSGYIPYYIRNLSIGTTNSSVPTAQKIDRDYLE